MNGLRATFPISALPFWESHRDVYISFGVGVGVFIPAHLLSGSWFVGLVASVIGARIAFVGKPLIVWGGSVGLSWLVLTWTFSGTNLLYPPDILALKRNWSSDVPINWWLPCLTVVAAVVWLGPARWGSEKTKSWLHGHRGQNLALVVVGLLALLMVGRLVLSDLGFLVRVGTVIGVFVMGWQWLSRLQASMKRDLKQMVVDSSVERARSDVADARIASLTRRQAGVAPQPGRASEAIASGPQMAPPVPEVISVFDPLTNGGGEEFTTSLTSEDVEAVNDNSAGDGGDSTSTGLFHDSIGIDLIESVLEGSEDDDDDFILLREARARWYANEKSEAADGSRNGSAAVQEDAEFVEEPDIVPTIPPDSGITTRPEPVQMMAVEPVQPPTALAAPIIVKPSIPEMSLDEERRLRIRSEAVRLVEVYKGLVSSGTLEERFPSDVLPVITAEHEEVFASLEGGVELNRALRYFRDGAKSSAPDEGGGSIGSRSASSVEDDLYDSALGAPIMPRHEVERRLGDRGRELPEEDEIKQLLKRLTKYNGTEEFYSYLDFHIRGLIAKDALVEFDRVDFGLCKGLLGLVGEEALIEKGFGSVEAAANRLVFFLAHKVTVARFAKVRELAETGFQSEADLRWAQGLRAYFEAFFEAFPEHQDVGSNFTTILNEAEFRYDFAGTRELVQEGLISRAGLDSRAIGIGRSRVLGSSLPPSAQEAMTQFISLQKPIDIIEIAMRQESMISRKDEVEHPLYPAYMALYCRAYQVVCQLKASLQNRPALLEQLPVILKARDEQLLGLFHRIERDGETYETWVREQKEKLDHVAGLEEQIAHLREDLARRDAELQNLKETKSGLLVDPLEQLARWISEKKSVFKLIKDHGPVRLQANSSGHVITFVHGMTLNWKVENGWRTLASENGQFRVDLEALRDSLRGKNGMDEAMPIRLRVVIVNGGVVGARPQNFIFSDKEVLQNVDAVMNRCDVDPERLPRG